MRMSILFTFLAGLLWLAGVFAPSSASAGPNVPLCLAIQNNYNECLRRQQAERHRRHWQDERDRGRFRSRRHAQDCNVWLVPLKANHCF